MPVSAVVELRHRCAVENGGISFHNDDQQVAIEIPVDLWEILDRPDGLRVRVEDVFNDPDRRW